jgi:8-oxo-dGTP pyrophosphatase MutT (NUDIX family)
VAAVCYRIGVQGLEFLLVQSRGGRWIFPKGGVESGLTQAQSAALEAFEEAGVHGRIEEMAFARYRIDRIAGKSPKDSRKAATAGEAITAHLCEVSHLEPPQEADRNPTWFSAQKAKRRLLADRSAELGDELAGVVDRAVARIQRQQIRESHDSRKDPLQKVRFEAFDELGSDALMRYILRNNLAQRNRGEASARKLLAIATAGRLQLGLGAPALQRGRKN